MLNEITAVGEHDALFDPHTSQGEKPEKGFSPIPAVRPGILLQALQVIARFIRFVAWAVYVVLLKPRRRDREIEPDLSRTDNPYGEIFDHRIAALRPPQPALPPDYSKQQLRGATLVIVGLVFLIAVAAMTMLAISQREPVDTPRKADERGDRQRPSPEDLTTKARLLEAATKKKREPALDVQVRQALEQLNNPP